MQWRVAARMRAKISASPRTSSCAVGSSSRTTPAPSCTAARARASATRCHCPPDSSVPPSYPRARIVSRSASPCPPAARKRRLDDLVGRAAGCDVVPQRELVAHVVLEHRSHPRAVVVDVEVADVDPVDLDRPALRVVEPAQQLGQRRLAGAVDAHDRHRGPGGDRQVEVVEDGPVARVVAEGDVAEPDLAGGQPGRPAATPRRAHPHPPSARAGAAPPPPVPPHRRAPSSGRRTRSRSRRPRSAGTWWRHRDRADRPRPRRRAPRRRGRWRRARWRGRRPPMRSRSRVASYCSSNSVRRRSANRSTTQPASPNSRSSLAAGGSVASR